MVNMSKAKDREKVKVEHVNGGEGFLVREQLITEEQRGIYCRMFNQIRLEPGCEIGYHEHHGESETYYILEGKGIYEEDGVKAEVEAGDVTFCDDGHGHGLKNNGKSTLVFVALILKK